MRLAAGSLLLWLSLGGGLAQSEDTGPAASPAANAAESYSDWGLRHIRGGFESVNSYFDSFLELLGGKDGVCQYRCRYGECQCRPLPGHARPGPRAGRSQPGTGLYSVPRPGWDCHSAPSEA